MIAVRQSRGHRVPSARGVHHDLPPRARDAGVVTWCSFLAASLGTAATFAFLDPARIPLDAVPLFWQSRSAIYAVGFFLLWAIAALSAFLTLYMVRSEHGRPRR